MPRMTHQVAILIILESNEEAIKTFTESKDYFECFKSVPFSCNDLIHISYQIEQDYLRLAKIHIFAYFIQFLSFRTLIVL